MPRRALIDPLRGRSAAFIADRRRSVAARERNEDAEGARGACERRVRSCRGRCATVVWFCWQVTKQMGSVVKGMDKVLASMDMNKISQARGGDVGLVSRTRQLRAPVCR